jgi:hypothetical protein
LILTSELWEEHQGLKKKIPGLRFTTYRKIVIPGRDAWVGSTREGICLCLEARYCHDPPGDKKEQALYYEKKRKAIAKEIPDAGGIITNHLMAVFDIVGLVPLWFVEEHTANTSSKSINFLVEKKGVVKGKPAAQLFLESLSLALECQHGIVPTRQYSKNVFCKAFCLSCIEGLEEHFSNLVFEIQCVF